MFHKEAEHGGAPGSALQPQQDGSFLLGWLSVREHKVKISAPPCGGFAFSKKKKKIRENDDTLFAYTILLSSDIVKKTSEMFIADY